MDSQIRYSSTHRPVGPSANASRVAVIIPHFNRMEYTAACCRSLALQTQPPRHLFIIDNGSTAHDEAALCAACPNARVIRLPENRGFAAAVNTGIREALADPGVDFMWVLNNDTICPPDALEKLTAAARANPRAGLFGCPMLEGNEDQHKHVAPGKTMLRPWMLPVNTARDRIPDYISGACLLIRRPVVERTGLFDERFFFFFEDADYSRRAIMDGWDLAVVPDLEIEHRGSSTVKQMNRFMAFHYRRGHILYLRKYTPYPWARALPPFLLGLLRDAAFFNRQALAGNWRGFWNGGSLRATRLD